MPPVAYLAVPSYDPVSLSEWGGRSQQHKSQQHKSQQQEDEDCSWQERGGAETSGGAGGDADWAATSARGPSAVPSAAGTAGGDEQPAALKGRKKSKRQRGRGNKACKAGGGGSPKAAKHSEQEQEQGRGQEWGGQEQEQEWDDSWQELQDDGGYTYYYNETTGESSWA
jgi:hypothetical protein